MVNRRNAQEAEYGVPDMLSTRMFAPSALCIGDNLLLHAIPCQHDSVGLFRLGIIADRNHYRKAGCTAAALRIRHLYVVRFFADCPGCRNCSQHYTTGSVVYVYSRVGCHP